MKLWHAKLRPAFPITAAWLKDGTAIVADGKIVPGQEAACAAAGIIVLPPVPEAWSNTK